MITEIKLEMYPRSIWIATGDDLINEINEQFIDLDNKSIEDDILIDRFGIAIPVIEKNTKFSGMLICLDLYDLDEKNIIGIITHEVCHACFNIMDYLGIEYHPSSNNEHITYFIGYVTTKIVDILKLKIIIPTQLNQLNNKN